MRLMLWAGLLGCVLAGAACGGGSGSGSGASAPEEQAVQNPPTTPFHRIWIELVEAEGPEEAPIAEGALVLIEDGSGEPAGGSWTLSPVGGRVQLPLGSGDLRWSRAEDSGTVVNLHPHMADNNIVLVLAEIGSRWSYSTFAGVRAEGPLLIRARESNDPRP